MAATALSAASCSTEVSPFVGNCAAFVSASRAAAHEEEQRYGEQARGVRLVA